MEWGSRVRVRVRVRVFLLDMWRLPGHQHIRLKQLHGQQVSLGFHRTALRWAKVHPSHDGPAVSVQTLGFGQGGQG